MTKTPNIHCKSCTNLTSLSQMVQGRCPDCNESLLDAEGLYDFRSRGTDYYFADVSRSDINELLRVQQEQGWQEALRVTSEKYGRTAPHLTWLMVDSRRASWVYLTRPAAFDNVLEIGCGWGGSVPLLASQFDHVFAVDLTKERIQFAQRRCLEMGIKNASFGIGFDSTQMPFPSESFDLVAMSGVLAYLPLILDGNPREAQLDFLREVSRIIRPGGALYVGSQNRFGWPYVLGARDHLNLKWTSVIPRTVANWYSMIRTGTGYRTYTYTANGYRRLFKEAGFQEIDFYWPHHNHSLFRLITSLDKKGTRFILKTSNKWSEKVDMRRLIVRPANAIGLFPLLAPSFSIVCHR